VAQEDPAFAAYVRNSTKPCPECRVLIVRESGCSTMRCTCGCTFCWKCGSQPFPDCRCNLAILQRLADYHAANRQPNIPGQEQQDLAAATAGPDEYDLTRSVARPVRAPRARREGEASPAPGFPNLSDVLPDQARRHHGWPRHQIARGNDGEEPVNEASSNIGGWPGAGAAGVLSAPTPPSGAVSPDGPQSAAPERPPHDLHSLDLHEPHGLHDLDLHDLHDLHEMNDLYDLHDLYLHDLHELHEPHNNLLNFADSWLPTVLVEGAEAGAGERDPLELNWLEVASMQPARY